MTSAPMKLRMDAVMARTRRKAVQREADREQLATVRPPMCDECGEPFPDGHPLRERALDRMQRGCSPHPGLCWACSQAVREQRAAEAAERAEPMPKAGPQWHTLAETLAIAGIPPALLAARFDNCPDLLPGLVDRVRTWAESPSGFMLLTGPVGCGKSWLAASAVAHIIDNGGSPWGCVRFQAERTWLRTVRKEFGNVVRDDRPARAKVLAYDDLAGSYLDDLRRGGLQDLLRTRADEQRPTVLTTNLTLPELDAALGSRVVSIIRQDKNVLDLSGDDLRQSGTVKGKTAPTMPPDPAASA